MRLWSPLRDALRGSSGGSGRARRVRVLALPVRASAPTQPPCLRPTGTLGAIVQRQHPRCTDACAFGRAQTRRARRAHVAIMKLTAPPSSHAVPRAARQKRLNSGYKKKNVEYFFDQAYKPSSWYFTISIARSDRRASGCHSSARGAGRGAQHRARCCVSSGRGTTARQRRAGGGCRGRRNG